ncbi:bifunctional metallophosphatase/5'-nucleotidase [Novosphingobium profundi]|uniref:bifunctional metallophosphatase/5'-nucleotidase n=1 Tax=Novosphingobium profundi TaxID=1774954 RepID=UPI001CFDEF81|nr:bifunctional metallophosphatase/5'-nucleotidase [Novosphingobium profundi]
MTRLSTRTRALSAAALLAPLLAACATPQGASPSSTKAQPPVEVGILAFNDFHGNIAAPKATVSWPDGQGGTVKVPAGGAAHLASALDALRQEFRYSATVSAGDLISASPLASSLFLDEPSIGVMNRIGLDFNAVGNHEFDRGRAELLRVQNGGCEKNTQREPCQLEQFAGANFRYLSASTYTEDGTTLFPATGLKSFGEGAAKVTLGFVGLTLKGTPSLVSPGGIAGLTFGDEAEAINRAVPVLRREGADAVIVLIHQGGAQADTSDPNACDGFTGDIQPILDKLSSKVDVVISGHTHQAYICEMPREGAAPLLLTSAGSYGRMVTRLTLDIDPTSDHVVSAQARNLPVQSEGYTTSRGEVAQTDLVPVYPARADIAQYVGRYLDAASAYSERTVGHLSGGAPRDWPDAQEDRKGGPVDQLIADSQLAATRAAGAQIAFMNSAGVRAPIEPGADGAVTFGQIFTVQPFGNTLMTRTFTGAQIKAILESGVGATPSASVLVPSSTLTYTIDRTRHAGDRITQLAFNGQPLDLAARYRVTVNSFLDQGGDGYVGLSEGTNPTVGGLDLDALEAWLSAVPVRTVPETPRVRVIE